MEAGEAGRHVVTTERLRLEPWGSREHTEALVRLSRDPEVMQFVGGPIERASAEEMSGHLADHWSERGWGLWAVVPLATAVPVGFAGLCHPYWQPEYAETGAVEVAWRLDRAAWGNGYATEAGRAALEEAWGAGLEEVIAFVDEANTRSLAVTRRLGMRFDKETVDPRTGDAILVYTVTRPG